LSLDFGRDDDAFAVPPHPRRPRARLDGQPLLTQDIRQGEADLRLFEAPGEELASLPVREPIAGYWYRVGTTFDGGTRLA